MVYYQNRPVLIIDECTLLFKDNGTMQYGAYEEADLTVR